MQRHCHCQRAHRKWRESLQFLVWGSFHYMSSLLLDSVLRDSQPLPLPGVELQQEGECEDLSSWGLTKDSRSWASMKHVLMRKPGPKVTSRAFRKEGSWGLERPPSSSSSSLETVFPGATATLCLVGEEGAVGIRPHEAKCLG